VGKRRGKGAACSFYRRWKRNEADFASTKCPPAAQEKAIAEAKALAEKE
jgi:hypothetical protein